MVPGVFYAPNEPRSGKPSHKGLFQREGLPRGMAVAGGGVVHLPGGVFLEQTRNSPFLIPDRR